MNSSSRLAVVFLSVALLLIGCAAKSTSSPRLTAHDATALADAKAKAEGYDLKSYYRKPATYDSLDNSWWTNYIPRGEKYAEFSVQVENSTRKAWLVLKQE